jgi:hypothetical protein
VDSLYTDEINLLIDSDNVHVDKKTFLMFVIMYFATRLYASDNTVSKEHIKVFLTDMIRNPEKRIKCIEIFLLFERNLSDTLTLLH